MLRKSGSISMQRQRWSGWKHLRIRWWNYRHRCLCNDREGKKSAVGCWQYIRFAPTCKSLDLGVYRCTFCNKISGRTQRCGDGSIVHQWWQATRRTRVYREFLWSYSRTDGQLPCASRFKTLHVRMDRHCSNGKAIAQFLKKSPESRQALLAGISDHPNHEIAKNRWKILAGMISFTLKGNPWRSFQYGIQNEVFSLAESLGGVESLIGHPASMTHASIPKEIREKTEYLIPCPTECGHWGCQWPDRRPPSGDWLNYSKTGEFQH